MRRMTAGQLGTDAALASLGLFFGLAAAPADRSLAPLLVAVLLAVALGLRRLSPPLALALAWLGAVTQILGAVDLLVADAMILPVLYANGRYGSRRLRIVGLVSVGAGAALATVYLGVILPTLAGHDSGTLELVTRLFILMLSSTAVLGLSWTLGLLLRSRDAAKDSERERAEERHRRELSEHLVIVEQERTRIARDMHDVVAHSLAVVIAQADGARFAAAARPELAATALATIADTARESLGEVRALLTALRHREGEGPQPGLAELPALLGQFRAAGLSIREERRGAPIRLGRGPELAAYRIAQEALTNALRHGEPGADVRLLLVWSADALSLTVENRAAAAGAPELAGGHGLPGMRERAAIVGGTLEAGPGLHGAFLVAARIPAGRLPAPAQPAPPPAPSRPPSESSAP